MDFIYDRNSNIIFSLHDSKVNEIKFHNKRLTLKLNKIFQYTEGEERSYSGEVFFENSDIDLCNVLIFNKTLGEGRFSGKAIDLHQFMDEYTNSEFEIITEGYFGNNTMYTGWLWDEGKQPVSAIMYIWICGDMVYRVEE